jgi:RecA/RadA recombinase
MSAMLKVVEKEGMENKNKALDAALAQIERAFGKGSIMKLGQREALEIESISTGSLGLDIALGIGGLPKGRIVEIYGPESSGKTTLALHCVAEAQKKGGACAFIDAEHALDPAYAKKLGVDEGAGAALLLGFGENMQRQRGLARAFRAVDFNDAAARQSADAECYIEAERTGRDDVGLSRGFARTELHDGALAERAFDLTEGRVECLLLIHGTFNQTQGCGRHAGALFSHTLDRSAM